MSELKVSVRKSDIRGGIKFGSSSCPIAIAVRRSKWMFASVMVGTDRVSINGREYDLPKEAAEFRERFDRGLPVQPFTFSIQGA